MNEADKAERARLMAAGMREVRADWVDAPDYQQASLLGVDTNEREPEVKSLEVDYRAFKVGEALAADVVLAACPVCQRPAQRVDYGPMHNRRQKWVHCVRITRTRNASKQTVTMEHYR